MKGYYSEHQLCNSLWWPIHVINSVDNTKLMLYSPTDTGTQFLKKLTPFMHLLIDNFDRS